MDRRELLAGSAALAAAAAAGAAFAADEHDHHMHHGGGKFKALVTTAADCIHIGEECMNHCLDLLATGDKELGACAKSVNQMLAACNALVRLGTQESKYLPKMAALAGQICDDCEKECRKHEKKHAQCKACADACAACLKECKKVAA